MSIGKKLVEFVVEIRKKDAEKTLVRALHCSGEADARLTHFKAVAKTARLPMIVRVLNSRGEQVYFAQ